MLREIQAKIQDWTAAQAIVNQWRAAGEKIVFTNGCFDLLHYGHIHYLAQASELGDRLVIGLNSQESVQRLKGAHRPIKDELSRQYQLAAMGFVGLVVGFSEATPLELIQLLAPDVLVKGGDWQPEQIVGSDFVLARGGKVQSLPFIEGYSTTAIERKIREEKM